MMYKDRIFKVNGKVIQLIWLFALLGASWVPASNRVLNSGFEYLWGSGNVLARHWTRSNTSYCYATSGAGIGHSGNAAVYVTSADVSQINSWTSEKFAVTPGATYTCQVWMKWDNVSAGTIRARFRCYDANGVPGTQVGEFTLSTTGNSTGGWVKFSGNYTVPSSGRCMDVYLATENANAGAWVLFDDVLVENPTPGTPPDNLIINGDFKGIDGTYPAFWRRNTSVTYAGLTSGLYRSATTSVYITQVSGANFIREWYIAEGSNHGYIAIDSTKNYRFGGWLQWSRVTIGNIGVRVEWMDYSDDTISITAIATNGNNTSQWMNLDSGVVSPPAGAVAARVRLFNTDTVSVNATGWFDDVYFQETNQTESSFTVRALSYNIHHCEGTDSVYNVNRVADVIADENPDIVGLNEIWNLYYSPFDNQVELIRARLQSRLGGTWYSAFGANVDYGFSIRIGNAILSRYPIISYSNYTIKPTLGSEQRGCLWAAVNVNGTIVNVFVTHWAHDDESERQLSADSCLVWMSQVPEPKILLGDLNARSNSDPFRRMQTQYVDTIGVSGFGFINTVSNPNPTVRIDHIVVPQYTTVKEAHVVSYGDATVASDHRPVTALIIGGGYVKPDIPSPNRIYNSGFEFVSGDSARFWFASDAGLCKVTTDSHSGSYAVYCRSTSNTQINKWFSNFIAVTPGQTYNCSGWLKWANVTTGKVNLEFKCYTANSSAYYSDNALGSLTLQTSGNSVVWSELSGTYTVPSTGAALRVVLSIESANPGSFVIFDDISVENQQDIPENLIINNNFEGRDDAGGAYVEYGAYWRRSTSTTNARQVYTYYVSPTTSYWIMNPPGSNQFRRNYQAFAEVGSPGSPVIIPITIDTAKNYRYGAKLRTYCAPTSINGNAQAGIQLYWYNASDNLLGITSTYITISNNSSLSPWIDLTGTIGKQNIPAGATYTHFNIYLLSTLSNATAWFDDVYFLEDDYIPVELSEFRTSIDDMQNTNTAEQDISVIRNKRKEQ
ncbi:MAG: endonuclease/exonuclease/phosphatase family protein [bacterium]|nr:endonuclease/exonuclease/phosphatase family protein [bacterium]